MLFFRVPEVQQEPFLLSDPPQVPRPSLFGSKLDLPMGRPPSRLKSISNNSRLGRFISKTDSKMSENSFSESNIKPQDEEITQPPSLAPIPESAVLPPSSTFHVSASSPNMESLITVEPRSGQKFRAQMSQPRHSPGIGTPSTWLRSKQISRISSTKGTETTQKLSVSSATAK